MLSDALKQHGPTGLFLASSCYFYRHEESGDGYYPEESERCHHSRGPYYCSMKECPLLTSEQQRAQAELRTLLIANSVSWRIDVNPGHRILEYLDGELKAYMKTSGMSWVEDSVLEEDYEAVIADVEELRCLYKERHDPPATVIEVVQAISIELLKYLKRYPEALDNITPRVFEKLVAEILVSYGWTVNLTPKTRDGGYDIFAISKDVSGLTTSWVIECKRYSRQHKVGVEIARALYAVKAEVKAANALLATTTYFTKGVTDFKASRYDLELRDYEGILEWINEYHPNPSGTLYLRDGGVDIFRKDGDSHLFPRDATP